MDSNVHLHVGWYMDLEYKLCYALIGGLMFGFAHCCGQDPVPHPNLRIAAFALVSKYLEFMKTYSTKSLNQVEEVLVHPMNSIEVLRKWGCSDTEVSKLFVEKPSLRKANITWFLSCRINHCFDERLEFF